MGAEIIYTDSDPTGLRTLTGYVLPQNSIAYKAKAKIDKVPSGNDPAAAYSYKE